MGKIIPSFERDGSQRHIVTVSQRGERRPVLFGFWSEPKHEERVMYIGLGGLLILILVLWLLGVI